jgi:flagellin-specific chaperone FliS
MTLTNEQIDKITLQLNKLYSTTDNLLYDRYSPESLKKELAEIEESISLMEQLRDDYQE